MGRSMCPVRGHSNTSLQVEAAQAEAEVGAKRRRADEPEAQLREERAGLAATEERAHGVRAARNEEARAAIRHRSGR